MIKSNPKGVVIDVMSTTVWSLLGTPLGVIDTCTIEGVSIWHSDWVSVGTNKSHSKSTAYGMSFKKRMGLDRYQFLRAVYSCCVWAASLVLIVPENMIAPATSLLQNEWVMVMEKEDMFSHTVPCKETMYIKTCCSSLFNWFGICCKRRTTSVKSVAMKQNE